MAGLNLLTRREERGEMGGDPHGPTRPIVPTLNLYMVVDPGAAWVADIYKVEFRQAYRNAEAKSLGEQRICAKPSESAV